MRAEVDKEILVDAIIGAGFKSEVSADNATKCGLAVFTGNQWNPSWRWDRAKLNTLGESALGELYETIRGKPK